MSSFPCLVRSSSPAGEPRYELGEPLVDSYLAFVAGRARPNTLRATAHDLKTFFTVIDKHPVDVAAADVFAFLAQHRRDRDALDHRPLIAGSRSGREDVVVPAAATTCSVCHLRWTRGSSDGSGEIFICVGCPADAGQFLAIQEVLWGSARDTREATDDPWDETQMPEQL